MGDIRSMLNRILSRMDEIEAKLDAAINSNSVRTAQKEVTDARKTIIDVVVPEITKPQPVACFNDDKETRPRGPNKVSNEHIQNVEEAGRYYFKRDILDRLDKYFDVLRAMKRADPEAYTLYSRVGAPIVGPRTMFHYTSELPPSWRHANIPAFGAVALLAEAISGGEKDVTYPDFVYWQRMSLWRSAIEGVRHGETMLEVTYLFSPKQEDHKHAWPMTFHVAVNPAENKVRILREMNERHHLVNEKSRRVRPVKPTRSNSKQQFSVPVKTWGIPSHIKAWWDERKSDVMGECRNINDYVTRLLCLTAYANENARLDIQINVRHENLMAVFCIDMLRTPYFFADRDTEDGQKRKIFHIVKAHERIGAGGNKTVVRSHFRGERSFKWNGYDVNITLPGKHHADLLTADFGSAEHDAVNDRKQYVSMRSFADKIQKAVAGH